MTFDIWITFALASTALLLIPGPTVLLVLSYALSQGRRVALASALGVATGDLIAMSASLMGLGALLMTSALAFTVVKWVGAIYLIWMGISLLRSAPSRGLEAQTEGREATPRAIFRHTAIVTALNPKSIAFFVAFVPQFLQPGDALTPQAALLIATFVTLAGLNALAYALAADRLRLVVGHGAVVTWLTRAGGAALIAMGLMTAALRRTS